MKPFKVCDRHRIPVNLYTEEQYETHMRNVHRATWLSMLQEKKNRDNAMKNLNRDPYEEYYGGTTSQ